MGISPTSYQSWWNIEVSPGGCSKTRAPGVCKRARLGDADALEQGLESAGRGRSPGKKKKMKTREGRGRAQRWYSPVSILESTELASKHESNQMPAPRPAQSLAPLERLRLRWALGQASSQRRPFKSHSSVRCSLVARVDASPLAFKGRCLGGLSLRRRS